MSEAMVTFGKVKQSEGGEGRLNTMWFSTTVNSPCLQGSIEMFCYSGRCAGAEIAEWQGK